jgi:putative ABC transport system permease protein
MFVILIIVYARQELTTDRFHRDAERIYMLGNEEMNMSAYGIGERVKERYPEIEDYCYVTGCILFAGSDEVPVVIENKKWNTSVSFVNGNFFSFFSFPLVVGNEDYVMSNKSDVVISESYGRKVFGRESPIGKTLVMNDTLSFVVNGVMKDIRNSVIKYNDILVRTDNLRNFRSDMDGNTFNNALSTNLFLKEREGSSLASKAEDMRDYFKGLYWFYEREVVETVQFIPITEAYYAHQDGYMYNKGDKKLVLILLTVGLLILIFAVINYINLTVAQTGFRAKEMATRSLLGSSWWELFSRMIGESTVLTFISFLIGTLLAFAARPYAERILDTSIDLYGMLTPVNILLVVVAIILIGFITGFLPAVLISKTKAVDVVKGGFRKKTKMVFSRFFITFQNGITIALIAAAFVMITQINHLIKAPLGYNTKNIIELSVMELQSKERIMTLANEFRQLSQVSLVSTPAGTPFNGGNNNTIEFEGRSIGFQTLTVDSAFMEMMGIEIIRENHVSSDKAFYLSEYALKEENLPLDAHTFSYYEPDVPIAGVFKDFQLNNILHGKRPVLIQIKKNGRFISVEYSGTGTG